MTAESLEAGSIPAVPPYFKAELALSEKKSPVELPLGAHMPAEVPGDRHWSSELEGDKAQWEMEGSAPTWRAAFANDVKPKTDTIDLTRWRGFSDGPL